MTNYSDQFAELWNAFTEDYGKKGVKKLAYAQYRKINPDHELHDAMVLAVLDQQLERDEHKLRGIWMENFQHVERWLKNERWEDEIRRFEPQQNMVDSLTDRSWSE